MLRHLMGRLGPSTTVGIDVGSAAIKVVELDRAGNRLVLRRAMIAALGTDSPSAVLKTFFNGSAASTQANIGLASPEVAVRPFAFPPMPRKELAAAIQLEAEQAILNGHGPEDVVTDWHLLPSTGKDGFRGVLAVVPRSVLESRMQLLQQASLRPAVVDVESLALWNAYWALLGSRESSPKTVLLVNVGAATTNLVIATGRDALIVTRDLQLGARALEAQPGDWIAEVRDSLAYARSHGGLRSLDQALLTGGGATAALLPTVQSAIPVSVEIWNPLAQLARETHQLSIDESGGPLLAVAIGLALRQAT